MENVTIMDCDRQHSMVAKRQADAKFLQTESVPYELKSIEIDTLQSAEIVRPAFDMIYNELLKLDD